MKLGRSNRELLATFAVLIAVTAVACGPAGTTAVTPSTVASTTSTISGTPVKVTVDLVARGFAFEKTAISVPAGSTVTLNFSNQDSGVPHNFAAYTNADAAKSIFVGQVISGPGTVTYTFTAPSTPGNYFFRCDVHPNMTGTFTVTP